MKRLTLIRHAKSSWNDPELTDFERPLNNRGRRDAPTMAPRAIDAFGVPDLWLSSPASRAMTTARLFADALALSSTDILLDARIYDAGVERLITVISGLPSGAQHAWLFGHNPGLTDFARWLDDSSPAHMATCAMAGYELQMNEWPDLAQGCGRLIGHLYPKQLIG